ncbi:MULTISPECIES: CPXCG motif-containing cysteine-rich protein [Modicisalibacter]|uniref:CPXCG motif-containing cysteine-rich protein n=1 Tax=Modicisalibacter TaxID=574347 RepID=UPI00100B7700|nr:MULTISPECIES: CPXCG motif-containing cysteine-rich protein [Halomonadaceae]MBZ9558147.1 CPXCG motif-containing cysteine-rich protein [Modicisalibacter sp. R2A 31.J]MBZ9573184.1 CPXCG motif-containing cysteine-rich protein [Modicisalibacter sp. MOD 31.J]
MNEEMLVSYPTHCPYCGAAFDLLVDASQGSHVTWEDCPRCCAPMQVGVEVSVLADEIEQVTVARDDDIV